MPPNEVNSETITLRGPQEKLGLALTKVYEKANSVSTTNISCPSWLHRYIIGKKGSGIQKIATTIPSEWKDLRRMWRRPRRRSRRKQKL